VLSIFAEAQCKKSNSVLPEDLYIDFSALHYTTTTTTTTNNHPSTPPALEVCS
jgi:hypothetical protein